MNKNYTKFDHILLSLYKSSNKYSYIKASDWKRILDSAAHPRTYYLESLIFKRYLFIGYHDGLVLTNRGLLRIFDIFPNATKNVV